MTVTKLTAGAHNNHKCRGMDQKVPSQVQPLENVAHAITQGNRRQYPMEAGERRSSGISVVAPDGPQRFGLAANLHGGKVVEVDADGTPDAAEDGVEESLPAHIAELLSAGSGPADAVGEVEDEGRRGGHHAEIPGLGPARVQDGDEGEEALGEHGPRPRATCVWRWLCDLRVSWSVAARPAWHRIRRSE